MRAERAALANAQFDDLTGTYRRTKGDSELQAEIDRALRFGGLLVLAFVDVDELKAHNDREGHGAGDRLLLDVVASIRSKLSCSVAVISGRFSRLPSSIAAASMVDRPSRRGSRRSCP